MSPQVTFKSNTETPAEQTVARAPRLADAVCAPYTPSHGSAPSELPQQPVGLEDLGPAAALRVVGREREKWLQGMQSNDLAAAPFGGAVAGVFLGGKGRLVAEGLLWRLPEEVIVTAEPARFDALRTHLDKLLIMEDCEILAAKGLRRLRYWPSEAPPRSLSRRTSGHGWPLALS